MARSAAARATKPCRRGTVARDRGTDRGLTGGAVRDAMRTADLTAAEMYMISSQFSASEPVNPYALLGAAIVSELLGTTSLKLSEGFSRPVPSLGVVVGYGLAFYLVSLTLEDLPIGVVYGTWAALGIVGVAAIGVVAFDEPVDLTGVVGLLLILAGIYCVNVLSEMAAH